MIFEIRDYHYQADRLEEYRVWAGEAVVFLGERWDLLGWWMDSGAAPRIMGSDPMQLKHGLANITWMLRWDSIEERESAWEELWENPKWLDLWDRHPGFEGYLQLAVRFMEEV